MPERIGQGPMRIQKRAADSREHRWAPQTLAPGVYRIDAVAAWGGVASGTVRVDGKTPVNWNRELRLR